MIARFRDRLRARFGPTLAGRAIKLFQRLQLRDRAAMITYYAMLSLFPALLFGASLVGLLGGAGLVTEAEQAATDAGLGAEAQAVVGEAVEAAIDSSGGALGLTSAIALGLALYGASGVLGAVGRTLDDVFGAEPDDEPGMLRRRATAIALTVGLALLGIVALAAVFVGGDLAHDIFDGIGAGDEAQVVWSIVRWPLALLAAAIAVSAVFRFTPSPSVQRARILTPGALTVVVLWIVLTAGFSFYLGNFGNYGAVYGAFASAVVLLLWLNLGATALLFGAAIDAEREREPAS